MNGTKQMWAIRHKELVAGFASFSSYSQIIFHETPQIRHLYSTISQAADRASRDYYSRDNKVFAKDLEVVEVVIDWRVIDTKWQTGAKGVRDPDCPCEEFVPRESDGNSIEPDGNCEGDGHYLCDECTKLRGWDA